MIRDIVMTQSGNSTIPLTDINAANVSLLLNGDGTNGAQNNTFIDSSVNNATITRYGDTTQGSFSPFGNSWSNYFDGTGDYLDLANGTHLTLTNGDYTLEAWVSPKNYDQYSGIIAKRGDSGREYQLWLDLATGYLSCSSSGGTNYYSARVVPRNTWSHIAVVYTHSNTTAKLFHNGELVHTIANFDNTGTKNESVRIGSATSSQNLTGYISNARILKGTALYTSNFTPSTSPLTAITNTVLLTCQSNNFKDNSVNNATITVYGDTKVVKDSPFPEVYDKAVQGASAYVPSTSYLSIPSSPNYGLDADFTVEAWIYPNSYPTYAYIFSVTNNPNGFVFYVNAGSLKVRTWFSTDLLSVTAPPINAWTHVAATRSGTTLKIFVNGVQVNSIANSTNFPANAVRVGPDGSGGDWNGYISNLRIVKGQALYTSNFTPPTSPLSAIANTSLLLKCDNAGIVDATGKNDLVTYGNAQISTTTKKFGTGSMYFDGTRPSRLKSDATASLAFGTSDFTIEMWCYQVSKASGYPRLINFNADYTTNTHALMMNTNDAVNLFRYAVPGNIGDAIMKSTTTLSSNTWYHAAVTRSGITFRLYVNGVLEASYTSSATVDSNATSYITLGDTPTMTASEQFNGYIDDLRITKGIARYPLNIMPTQALPLPTATAAGDDPYWASVSLLLNGDGTNGSTVFTDLSSSPKAITTYGNAQISTTTKKFGAGSMYFDGTGDYLAIPNNPAFSFGTGDFTVECWSYTVSATAWSNFISTGTNSDGSNLGWKVGRNSTNNILSFGLRTGTDYTNYNGTAITWNNNTWYHFAAVRSGTTLTLYWDGVMAGVFTGMSAGVNTGSGGVSVGCRYASTTAEIMEFHNGYIDDLRVTKGVARYTANFTPPTQSLPLSGGNPLDPYSAHVSLLLNGDGANGSTTFTDLSLSPTTVTAYGNAQISTTTKKFGTGSMYFDGTGDWLLSNPLSSNALGAGDLTVECWVNVPTISGSYAAIVADNSYGAGSNGWAVYQNGAAIEVWIDPGVNVHTISSALNVNTWIHIAWVRIGTSSNVYINGVASSLVSNSTAYSGTQYWVGARGPTSGSYPFTGYIDDLRITKGIARYTVNFTPPTQSLSL